MNNFLRSAALACIMAVASHAQADTYSYSGDTTGQPTYHRALYDFGALSGTGTDVAYDAFNFTVTASGLYSFESRTFTHDGFIFLYSAFNPASALDNGLIGNDDIDTTLRVSSFDYALIANTHYTFVNTGFQNLDAGTFATTITGPGTVTAVPEPETYAMLLAGLGLLGFVARRRRQS